MNFKNTNNIFYVKTQIYIILVKELAVKVSEDLFSGHGHEDKILLCNLFLPCGSQKRHGLEYFWKRLY